jgi:branched-chain amino acid transport system permease protein
MGIDTRLMIMLTFALSSMIGGAAGMLLAPVFFVSTDMGSNVVMKAFAATVMGGFGSILGAIVGGLLLGLIEIFAAYVISPVYQAAISFMLLILVLLFRPRGIFGEKISQKV